MAIILKILIVLVGMYILLRAVGKYFLRQFFKKINQQAEEMRREFESAGQPARPEGDIRVEVPVKSASKTSIGSQDSDPEEYIEFEDV